MGEQADDIAMAGGGAYSLATRGAKDVIDAATPLVLDAIERMKLSPTRERFQMMDIGCADGGTSLDMVRAALTRVREIAPRAELTITYSDQPRNDFNALVGIVHGNANARSPFRPYLGDIDRAYALFSANSFYTQALPDGSLDLGFSATAMHWLRRKPGNLAAHVHMVGANDDERALFARQAADDWETILLHRAREMAPGARLVLVNFCRDADGRYLGNTGGVNMFDLFNQLWQAFVADGRITADEYAAMTLPQYYRDLDEFTRPLTDSSSRCYRAGLRLESIETRVVPCPFAQAYREHGDAERFADGLIPTLRSWNESIFFAALDRARPHDERRAIIEDYYGAYRAQVLREPQRHGMGYVHAYKTICKV